MKKILSAWIGTAMMLIFALGAMAVSGEQDTPGSAGVYTLQKVYLESDGEVPDVFPRETLQFQVTGAKENPEDAMIRVEDLTVEENPDTIRVTLPAYKKAGQYRYRVKELPGTAQGVTYNGEAFQVLVVVYWNEAHTELITSAAFCREDNGEKIERIVNRYDLGELEIEKEVTGNLGDREQNFLVDVTFTAEKGRQVTSDITYEDGEKTLAVTPRDLSQGSCTVTIDLRHGETVEFDHIPVGVSYHIRERDYTAGDANSEGGYDVPLYQAEDGEPAAAPDGFSGCIQMDEQEGADADVEIINNKGAIVETGVVLDSIPYAVLLIAVAGGVVLVVMKKRTVQD